MYNPSLILSDLRAIFLPSLSSSCLPRWPFHLYHDNLMKRAPRHRVCPCQGPVMTTVEATPASAGQLWCYLISGPCLLGQGCSLEGMGKSGDLCPKTQLMQPQEEEIKV